MKRVLGIIALLLAWFGGWTAHSLWTELTIPATTARPPPATTRPRPSDNREALQLLLDAGDYTAAVALFERLEAVVSNERSEGLRDVFRRETDYLLAGNRLTQAGDLLETYVDVYFRDVEMLHLLAVLRERQHHAAGAVAVLRAAIDHAPDETARERLRGDMTALASAEIERLEGQRAWPELATFLERLTETVPEQPAYRLRLAETRLDLGELDAAAAALAELRYDADFRAAAERLVERIRRERDFRARYEVSLPLSPMGEHHGLRVLLNERREATLLLDTGASTTVLTTRIAAALALPEQASAGRVMGTVTGAMAVPVVRLDELRLGPLRLAGVEAAIMDLTELGDTDGLLGMNVLGQFDFHIDQEGPRLLLHRR